MPLEVGLISEAHFQGAMDTNRDFRVTRLSPLDTESPSPNGQTGTRGAREATIGNRIDIPATMGPMDQGGERKRKSFLTFSK